MRLLPPLFKAQSAVPTLTTLTDTSFKTTRYPTLTAAPLEKVQTEALADELNELYQSVMDSLGSDDSRYIQRIYGTVVYSEVISRVLLAVAGKLSSKRSKLGVWLLVTSFLSFSKILNYMELGHNVMHGQ